MIMCSQTRDTPADYISLTQRSNSRTGASVSRVLNVIGSGSPGMENRRKCDKLTGLKKNLSGRFVLIYRDVGVAQTFRIHIDIDALVERNLHTYRLNGLDHPYR